MSKIEFGELRINQLMREHINECLDNNWVSIGKKTRLFEQEWQKLFDYKHTIMLGSGTDADIAACIALYDLVDARPGDYILCPALSYIATANAIRAAGFVPLFVDVLKETLNINVDLVDNAISKATKNIAGIMAVNLMGKHCDLKTLSEIAKNHNLPLIVDNCEAYGGQFDKKYALEYADMETTSHYIAHIICCGEGGTVSTNNTDIYNIIKSIRSHGRVPDSLYFDHLRYGLNLKPTDLHASIGLGEIDNFWDIFYQRTLNIKSFYDAVSAYKDKVYLIEEDTNDTNAPHAFSITLKEKYATTENIRAITNTLDLYKISWKRNFGSMPHHDAFKYLQYDRNSMPNARYIGDYGIHIGCHYWLSKSNVEYVCRTLKSCMELIQ